LSDRHLRVLRLLARRRQTALEEHDAAAPTFESGSPNRRRELAQRATQARARVAAAEERRRP